MNFICTKCDEIFSEHPMTHLNDEILVKEKEVFKILDFIEFEEFFQKDAEDRIMQSIESEYAETKSVELSNETKRKRKMNDTLNEDKEGYCKSKEALREHKKDLDLLRLQISHMKRKFRILEGLMKGVNSE